MEKKVTILKPHSLLHEAALEVEEQKVLAEAKETAKKKAKGAEVLAKAAEEAKAKTKRAGPKLKDDPKLQGVSKLPADPKAKEVPQQQQQFPPFQQNVTAMIKKATDPVAAALKIQTDLINDLKGQQEQFMALQSQKQASLQKRVSTMIGTLPVQTTLVENAQGQVGRPQCSMLLISVSSIL